MLSPQCFSTYRRVLWRKSGIIQRKSGKFGGAAAGVEKTLAQAHLEVKVEVLMIPARFAPVLFGLILSGLMSFIVSGLSTLRALGWVDDFVAVWLGNWAVSWAIAFPTVLVVAPITRRIVARLTA
ncbi:DUF2798 domain-containing protein [Tabrizicola sp.]|uniref:DUF2798 domain-containing protein n=1 Tax=Tabrizicola sp. TaxID=2005166 RepID=UPI003F2A2B47